MMSVYCLVIGARSIHCHITVNAHLTSSKWYFATISRPEWNMDFNSNNYHEDYIYRCCNPDWNNISKSSNVSLLYINSIMKQTVRCVIATLLDHDVLMMIHSLLRVSFRATIQSWHYVLNSWHRKFLLGPHCQHQKKSFCPTDVDYANWSQENAIWKTDSNHDFNLWRGIIYLHPTVGVYPFLLLVWFI